MPAIKDLCAPIYVSYAAYKTIQQGPSLWSNKVFLKRSNIAGSARPTALVASSSHVTYVCVMCTCMPGGLLRKPPLKHAQGCARIMHADLQREYVPAQELYEPRGAGCAHYAQRPGRYVHVRTVWRGNLCPHEASHMSHFSGPL